MMKDTLNQLPFSEIKKLAVQRALPILVSLSLGLLGVACRKNGQDLESSHHPDQDCFFVIYSRDGSRCVDPDQSVS